MSHLLAKMIEEDPSFLCYWKRVFDYQYHRYLDKLQLDYTMIRCPYDDRDIYLFPYILKNEMRKFIKNYDMVDIDVHDDMISIIEHSFDSVAPAYMFRKMEEREKVKFFDQCFGTTFYDSYD